MSFHNTFGMTQTPPNTGARNLLAPAGIDTENRGALAFVVFLLRSCLGVLRSGATPGLVFSSPLLIPGRFAAILSSHSTTGRAR